MTDRLSRADKKAVAYWIEVCKRAYADGDDRALEYIDALIEAEPTHPYLANDSVPYWLDRYWANNAYDRWEKDKTLREMAR